MADGNRNKIADITFIARNYHELDWENPKLAEAMDMLYDMARNRAIEEAKEAVIAGG